MSSLNQKERESKRQMGDFMGRMPLALLQVTGLLIAMGFSNAFAQTPAPAAPTGQAQRSCLQYQNTIASECTANPELIRTQNQLGVFARLTQRTESGSRVNTEGGLNEVKAGGQAATVSMNEVRRQCTESAKSCTETCEREAQQIPNTPENTARIQQMQQVARTCVQEHQQMQQRTQLALADIAQIMASVAQLLQALGIGQGGDGGFGDVSGPPTSNDPCEGQFKDMLIECSGQSGPSSSRAGVSGNLAGGTTGTGTSNGLFNASEQGEPGGEHSGSSAGSSAGAGFGGGMAPMGLTGFGGSSSGGSEAAVGTETGLDTNIHRGYMGAGGGDSGGGGGGGGLGGGRVGAFPTIGKTGDESSQGARAQLDRKINQLTNQGPNRAPASADGKNGPFDDNWSVVTGAYKKNTGSLFHQK